MKAHNAYTLKEGEDTLLSGVQTAAESICVYPKSHEERREHSFPKQIHKELSDLGLMGLSISDDFSGINAVSYTHLRAHETLRYLVCRLLLEKKN